MNERVESPSEENKAYECGCSSKHVRVGGLSTTGVAGSHDSGTVKVEKHVLGLGQVPLTSPLNMLRMKWIQPFQGWVMKSCLLGHLQHLQQQVQKLT